MDFYKITKEETYAELKSGENGLSSKERKERLEKYGKNELRESEKKSLLSKFIDQFKDFLILILIIAAGISLFIGDLEGSAVILLIVVINAVLSIYQEGQAEKSLEALKKMASPTAKVLEDGEVKEVKSEDLVIGDVVVLETGDIVPCDLRLIESFNLKSDESSLTGESVAVDKSADYLADGNKGIGDRHNMVFSGSIITYGRGRGIVSATGHDTEIGKIASAIEQIEEDMTPLQKSLNKLGKTLGIATIVICLVVFLIGVLQKRDMLEMFMTAVSLAVAAIPEGLPAIVTIVLAIGMNRMVKRNAIVKKLLAVETLGSTSTICSDKTGTLTQNKMTVTNIYINNSNIDVGGSGYQPDGKFTIGGNSIELKDVDGLYDLLLAAYLDNDARLVNNDGIYNVIGDPTEGALLAMAMKKGINEDFIKKYPRLQEIPFDSTRKMMTTFHNIEGQIRSMTKGAPDEIVQRSKSILLNGKAVPFTDELKKEIMNKIKDYSLKALRVLAYAYRRYDKMPENISSEAIEQDMIFIGLTGMMDPPREEVRDAVKLCKRAGIDIVMITGDYRETAYAIARDLDIVEDESQTIMGRELDHMSDEELRELVKKVKVYARVSPEHKVRIVRALKENDRITAMTGDGVNDALAIKKADIGISMGITGTDVAKNTSDVILTDDNFTSIVSAVEEGRIIYSNIKKFVYFLLSCNIGEIILVFVSILLNYDIPLLPIQLLWLNLITDSFPALALGVEEAEPGTMDEKPRDTDDAILNKEASVSIFLQAAAIGVTSLLAYYWGMKAYPDSIIHARTMTFTTLIMAELLRAFSARSYRYPIYKIGFFTNKKMILATSCSFILLIAVLYIPFLQGIFDTFALDFNDWARVLMFAFIPFILNELHKIIKKK